MVRGERVLVIGFDGLTFDVIDPLLKRGRLLNLAKLINSGARGRLYCPPPTNSITGWTSFMTGTNIGKHGIYNFETMVPGDGSFVATDSRMRANPPFWEILSRHGKTVVVINIIGTYPPDKVSGIMISGKPVPSGVRCYTHPEALTNDLARSGYSAPFSRPVRTEAEYLERVREVVSVAKDKMGENDWDCFVIGIIETDAFQHDHAGQLEKIEAFYEEMDRVVGELLEGIGEETTVVVCSDHGHATYTRSFYIERFLYQQGLLKLKDEKDLHRPVSWDVWRSSGNASMGKFVLFNGARILSLLASRLGREIPLPERLLSWMEAKERELQLDPVDWRSTVAFRSKRDGSTANSGGFRLHKRNIGIRSDFETEYAEVVARLKRELAALKDPETDQPVIDRVWTKEELYSGPMLDRLPDLIVRTRPFYHCERYLPHARRIRDPRLIRRYANVKQFHAEDGVLILSGRGVRSGVSLKATLFDIAPTILHLFGVPTPSYMDGTVLADALQRQFMAAHPVRVVELDGNLFNHKEFDFSICRPLANDIRDELVRLGYE